MDYPWGRMRWVVVRYVERVMGESRNILIDI
jgi:hypothetical protein